MTIGYKKKLSNNLVGEVKYQEPLAQYTTWRIGGTAETFIIPKKVDDLKWVIETINEFSVPLFVIGRGSNILIEDDGLPGVTLYMAKSFQSIEVVGSTLKVGGGVPLPKLAITASKLEFSGYEFMVGIPGTVGAGILINAGAGGYNVSDVLESVTVMDRSGDLKTIDSMDLKLTYRNSALFNSPVIVTEAMFKLENPKDSEKIQVLMKDFINKRREKFPLSYPNAGSVFKRPNNGEGPPSGWLLEKAEMKGFRIGDAQVSDLHANFIINLGNASSKDIKKLIEIMYQRVVEVHNIELERENIFLLEESGWNDHIINRDKKF